MESWPTQKPKGEIKEQVKEVNKALDVCVSPPSLKKGFLQLSIEEIKEKYPERYSAYLKILRSEKNNQNINEVELSNIQEWISALNNLDNYISTHQNKRETRILREKQFTVFEDIRNSFEQGKKEGYIKLPTGVGKTILFSQVVESLGMKTLICVPSKILIGQTGEKLEEFTDLEFGKYYQEEKDFSKDVTIITYASLIRGIENGTINPKDYGVLILDEAHKALGEKTSDAINKFDCIKLGFTATPKYTNEKHVRNILEHEIHSMSISEGIKSGLINRFKSIFAHTEADLSNVKIVNGEYDQEELEKAINTQSRNISAVQLYKEMFNGQSALTYCSSVAHAQDMTDLFNKHGVSAAVINGETTQDERDDIISKYHTGEIKMLCSVKVLIEGFDEPHASIALNLHPTLSKVDAEQRSGRVLRLDKDNPDKWAYVVDFIDKNARRPQVTFPQIADASELDVDIKSSEKPRGREGGGRDKAKLNIPQIQGLKIIIDSEEIMQMTRESLLLEQVFERKKWTYDSLRADVLAKWIKSSGDYKEKVAENRWPIMDTLTKMPEFPKNKDGSNDWDAFLNRERKKTWTYDSLRADVLEKGIKSSGDYIEKTMENKWIIVNKLTKMPEFPKNKDGSNDWDAFLNRERKKTWTYDSLRADVLEKGIKSSADYTEKQIENQWPTSVTLIKMPRFPKKEDGSNDWDAFLNRERRKTWTYDSLRADVLAKGIKYRAEYIEKTKINQWPNFLTLTKMPRFPKKEDGSNDWDTYFK